MSSSQIDKAFAEDLGKSLGGCATELTLGVYHREAARAARAGLSWLPFIGTAKRRRFQLLWSCCLESIAAWCAAQKIPEIAKNEKLFSKVVFNIQTYANSVMGETFLKQFGQEDLRTFAQIRREFMRLNKQPQLDKEDFSRAFLATLFDKKPSEISQSDVERFRHPIGLAINVFEKMIRISLEKLEAANQPKQS